MGINLGSTAISDVKLGSNQVDKVYLGSDVVWQKQAPVQVKALRFTSTGAQTLGINQSTLGTVRPSFEYSTDGETWTSWDITTTLSFGSGTDLYIRGSNTILASSGTNYTNFMFSTNSPVYCYGNVMHLYDHTQDLTSFPSASSSRGLKYLFANCTALVRPPSLPTTDLISNAYYHMFQNCSSLTFIPKLYNTNITANCMHNMFDGCSLIKMSETQEGEYTNIYTIYTGEGSIGTTNMFVNTGGTFQGTPAGRVGSPTVTLYTSNTIIDQLIVGSQKGIKW